MKNIKVCQKNYEYVKICWPVWRPQKIITLMWDFEVFQRTSTMKFTTIITSSKTSTLCYSSRSETDPVFSSIYFPLLAVTRYQYIWARDWNILETSLQSASVHYDHGLNVYKMHSFNFNAACLKLRINKKYKPHSRSHRYPCSNHIDSHNLQFWQSRVSILEEAVF